MQKSFNNISLEKRWGESIINPTLKDYKSAINELRKKDDEHPNTWIEDEDGNVVDVYQDGKVLFYNYDNEDETREINIKSKSKIIELWVAFSEGNDIGPYFK